MSFSEELNKERDRIGCKHTELCEILYDVPYRTYRGWLAATSTPPKHIQELVLYRLRAEPTHRPTWKGPRK